CVLMALSLSGMVEASRERIPCLPLTAPLAVLGAVHLAFYGEIRNRQYLTPLLYAFGGLALAAEGGHRGAEEQSTVEELAERDVGGAEMVVMGAGGQEVAGTSGT